MDAPLRADQVPALKLDSALRTAGEVDVLLSIIKATRNQLGKRARASPAAVLARAVLLVTASASLAHSKEQGVDWDWFEMLGPPRNASESGASAAGPLNIHSDVPVHCRRATQPAADTCRRSLCDPID